MERITQKKLKELLVVVNKELNTNMIVFPNMYGYGISNNDGIRYPNAFNGSAKECYAFMQGLLYYTQHNVKKAN